MCFLSNFLAKFSSEIVFWLCSSYLNQGCSLLMFTVFFILQVKHPSGVQLSQLGWVGLKARGGQAYAGRDIFWIPAVEMSNHWWLRQNRRVPNRVLSTPYIPFSHWRAMYLFVINVKTSEPQRCRKRYRLCFLLVLDKTCELPYYFSLFTVNFEKIINSHMPNTG